MAANKVKRRHQHGHFSLVFMHFVSIIAIFFLSEASSWPVIDEESVKRKDPYLWLDAMQRQIELNSPNVLDSSRFKYDIDDSYSIDSPVEEEELADYVSPAKMDNVENDLPQQTTNASLLSPSYFGGEFKPRGDDLVPLDSNSREDFWTLCQLPIFIVLFAVVCVLAVTFVVLLWLKSQMLESDKEKNSSSGAGGKKILYPSCPNHEEDRWIFHTVISLNCNNEGKAAVAVQPVQEFTKPVEIVENSVVKPREASPTPGPASQPTPLPTPERRPEAVRIRAKGLLERRGSNVSLTIDLPQANSDAPTHVITPTRECSAEEYLLSAGNSICRSQLRCWASPATDREEQRGESCLKDSSSLQREFWDIPLNHPEEVSAPSGSSGKNRYRSILPNERSRVILDNCEEPYINANYIRGYDGEEKAYIATQGPLSNTISDLYWMIWSHRCPMIVMMTHLVEKAKPKCEPYFPLGLHESASYGDFDVSVAELIHRQGYVLRHLLIQYKGETRRVLHYWYDTWPDHKTPQNAQAIIAMATEIEKIRTNLKNSKSPNNNGSECLGAGPVVVHCSAGIGRTGCFIAISLGICQLLSENKVDLLGVVCQMRYDRGGMIQTAEQYEFVHTALALFEKSLPDEKKFELSSQE